MKLDWQDFPDAPGAGQTLGADRDIRAGAITFADIDGFPVILTRLDGRPRAYVNACPHQFLPFNQRSDQVLGADGKTLICSNHDAGFSLATGKGISGEGLGACLSEIPVLVANGQIIIANEA